MSQPLIEFVYQALQQGLSRPQITEALLQGGWSPQEIETAMLAFVESKFPIPVPRKRASTSPREAFLFLVLFASLYTWMFALGGAAFDLINLWMPQAREYPMHSISGLRGGVASVLVAFPLFLFMDYLARTEARRNPGQRISPIRRWLTYLTLFSASVALVSDLITLILTFLEGEVTWRFGLKVLVVALLAGLAFSHYLRQLLCEERDPQQARPESYLGRWVMVAGVLVVMGVAIWNAGSPLRARLVRQDAQRVRDLGSIQRNVSQYFDTHGELPRDLVACDVSPSTSIDNKLDPVTKEPYGYRVVDATHAEILAVFALPTPREEREDGFWEHGAGPKAFRIEVTRKEP